MEHSETLTREGTVLVACRIEDLPPGESVRIDAADGTQAVAVFNADGELYAIDDTCTHQDASLADGWLEGCTVECPLHAACFDLRTGMPNGPPAKRPVRTHRVTVEDGFVRVHVAVPVQAF
ncbi:bifunctional 3-phenylpropionate/cinnamic acid dioxygenase ferredoxin subunit [Streptomyces sp. N2-109]|uniref:Bifunctional 3-phenylpropionate/cinnamic acid dioxygenase ferredoxin subunit n=1 Tax=Streptomyces gossypii TaxID=2883101 RepID=A0ABT2JSS7_9ACTN|nr:bifunctional 3-phenylpropionate/cinnamic acid dioxygenase ferredoxin subunit [Streptomyces gossypii]MCT2590816.1 bifunctional 3-phenylpropionate/cinnamic acid dioxygenase ferredoxin subunit [Streptomyces gossypii]